MFRQSFALFLPVAVTGAFFLTVLGALLAAATAIPAPRGALGDTDSRGSNTLIWVYPGLNDTTYRTGSDSWTQSMYISREHGAHRVACRFILSSVRQWVNWAEIRIEKGLGYDDDQWLNNAAISVGLCADSSGFPGGPLVELVECRPGQAGVPSDGGYLKVALDHPALFSPPDTLWLLIEWPPDYPDLVCVGVDDQPAAFNAMYYIDGQDEPWWITWVHHNFMIRLNTLRYDVSCAEAAGPGGKKNGRSGCWAGPDQFIVARTVTHQGMIVEDDPEFRVLPGEQTCLYDTAVFTGFTYDYEIRPVVDIDTGASAVVSLSVDSPFSCDWDTPQAPVFSGDEGISLPHTLHNSGQDQLAVYFLDGWMKLGSGGLLPDMGWPSGEDSIPLYVTPESAVVDPAGATEFNLFPGSIAVGAGMYVMNSLFRVADPTGRQIRYKFASVVQVSDAVGVIAEERQGGRSAPLLLLSPNPATGEVLIEFTPPLSEGEGRRRGKHHAVDAVAADYAISIYDVLGREVTRLDCVATGPHAGRYRAIFDGCDKYGNQLPSALYFIRVDGKGWVICRKLVVLH